MLLFKNSNTKLQRQFFRIISQNAEYVERFCKNGNNPLHFACRNIRKKAHNLTISLSLKNQQNFIS